jgi:hypothetical protein
MGRFAVDSCCWASASFQTIPNAFQLAQELVVISHLPLKKWSEFHFYGFHALELQWTRGRDRNLRERRSCLHFYSGYALRNYIFGKITYILFFYLGTLIFRNSLDCGCDRSETWYMASSFFLLKSLLDSSVDRLAWMKRKSSSHSSWISLFLKPGRSQSMW